jgi:hypothetical protein
MPVDFSFGAIRSGLSLPIFSFHRPRIAEVTQVLADISENSEVDFSLLHLHLRLDVITDLALRYKAISSGGAHVSVIACLLRSSPEVKSYVEVLMKSQCASEDQ